jgi:Fe-S-cluster containining protein
MNGPPPTEKTVVRLSLRVGGELLEAEVRVPSQPIRPVDLLPILMSLDDAIVAIFEREVQKRGQTISCHKGCGACCRQLVPIAEVEACYLAGIVAEMPLPRRTLVEKRFQEALAALDHRGMLDRLHRTDELVTKEARRQLGLDYFACGVACPFLEDEACSIHRDRPLACREFLVTSPHERCAEPLPQRIARVPMPVMLVKSLSRFGDGLGNRPSRWLPLVLALEWADHHRDDETPRLPGPQLLENFLRSLAD